MNNKLMIVGSPNKEGKTAYLARALVRSWQNSSPEKLKVFSVADQEVQGCLGCELCKNDYNCVIGDDMQNLYPQLAQAHKLVVVSPVFFAGPPAQMKAVLDRMQPYFWKTKKEGSIKKRPAELFVLGEGGDPHGFEPLVVSARSALASAGFKLESIYDCVGLHKEELKAVALDPKAYLYARPRASGHCGCKSRTDVHG